MCVCVCVKCHSRVNVSRAAERKLLPGKGKKFETYQGQKFCFQICFAGHKCQNLHYQPKFSKKIKVAFSPKQLTMEQKEALVKIHYACLYSFAAMAFWWKKYHFLKPWDRQTVRYDSHEMGQTTEVDFFSGLFITFSPLMTTWRGGQEL